MYGPSNNKAIRPTSDRAREALFNILSHTIEGAHVLDLFGGTGAFGAEAMSRGAASVTFVDNNQGAVGIIKKNSQLVSESLDAAGMSSVPVKIIKRDVTRLNFCQTDSPIQPGTFSLIFLDPPYSKGLVEKTLQNIDSHSILKPDLLIIAEERSKETAPDHFTHLGLDDSRKYGDTVFWFYTVKK